MAPTIAYFFVETKGKSLEDIGKVTALQNRPILIWHRHLLRRALSWWSRMARRGNCGSGGACTTSFGGEGEQARRTYAGGGEHAGRT